MSSIRSPPVEWLPRLLLDTTRNRLQLETAILEDESLKHVLGKHELIIVEGFARPFELRLGATAVSGIMDDLTTIRGRYRPDPTGPFVMPRVVGVLYDPADNLAWYQSSPQEFLPSRPDIQTSNVGGWPAFDLSKNDLAREFEPHRTLGELERRR